MEKNSYGFTLVELLIVIAIICILVATAIPGYIGMQQTGRKGALKGAAIGAEAEIQAWLVSSNKTGVMVNNVECDTNWDGSIDITGGTDLPNSALFGKVASAYVSARSQAGPPAINAPELSPWYTATSLWSLGTSLGESSPGQIVLSQVGNQISIVASDNKGNIIHLKIISAD